MEEKKKRGRPMKDGARRHRLELRLTDEEYELIFNYCVGKGLPNVHNLKKICRALKCSVYELVDMEYGEEE